MLITTRLKPYYHLTNMLFHDGIRGIDHINAKLILKCKRSLRGGKGYTCFAQVEKKHFKTSDQAGNPTELIKFQSCHSVASIMNFVSLPKLVKLLCWNRFFFGTGNDLYYRCWLL